MLQKNIQHLELSESWLGAVAVQLGLLQAHFPIPEIKMIMKIVPNTLTSAPLPSFIAARLFSCCCSPALLLFTGCALAAARRFSALRYCVNKIT